MSDFIEKAAAFAAEQEEAESKRVEVLEREVESLVGLIREGRVKGVVIVMEYESGGAGSYKSLSYGDWQAAIGELEFVKMELLKERL